MNLEMSSPRADASGRAKGLTPRGRGLSCPAGHRPWLGTGGHQAVLGPPITPGCPWHPPPPLLHDGSSFAGEAGVPPSCRESPSPGSLAAPRRVRKAGGRIRQKQQVQAKEEREGEGGGATTTETRETFPGGSGAGQALSYLRWRGTHRTLKPCPAREGCQWAQDMFFRAFRQFCIL